ncbi:hypothetical protein BC936DRAFT_148176 [Jimgerdemannia flammicorona]|uniref:Uncharacterized protein n=1 Tax=Jimgerdemannia flammicorona TaxID=994334 RepID=A0A433D3L9_9FUNG|nr:hypothetical protein BC936DRAFT_148176 [Jimgerdemannia flammicorona]
MTLEQAIGATRENGFKNPRLVKQITQPIFSIPIYPLFLVQLFNNHVADKLFELLVALVWVFCIEMGFEKDYLDVVWEDGVWERLVISFFCNLQKPRKVADVYQ